MFVSSESPLHQVLGIPLLVGLICQHLESKHILCAVLSSRAFHAAFLEHRWTSLVTCDNYKNIDIHDIYWLFPFNPSPGLAATLERYGPQFARHLALPYEDCRLRRTFLSYKLPFLRLKTLQQLGCQYDEHIEGWMHWDGPPQRMDAYGAEAVPEATSIHFNDMLTLAVKSRFTLRRLDMGNLTIETCKSQSSPLLTQLIRTIPTLEDLEILLFGPMPMVRIVDTVLHLPSRLQELYLTVWDETGFSTPINVSDEKFEETWALYWSRTVMGQDMGQSSNNNSGIDGDSEQGEHLSSPSSAPTARSLLENMSPMTRLTKFSLTDHARIHPEWIVLEIALHCPVLKTIGLPFLSDHAEDSLVEAIQEERLGRLEHLELSDDQFLDRDCTDLFETLLPSRTEEGKKAENEGNRQEPEVQRGSKDGPGVRSLTLLHYDSDDFIEDDLSDDGSSDDDDDGDRDYNGSASVLIWALTKHFPTLERISLVGCGETIQSSHILLLLERCPRLDTLILHEPPVSYHRLTCRKRPKVNWIDLSAKDRCLRWIHRNILSYEERQFISNTESDDEKSHWLDDVDRYNGGNANDGKQDKGQSINKLNIAASSFPLSLYRDSAPLPWPCSQTLRVLSLVLHISQEEVNRGSIPRHFAGIYQRFGQLVVLEDLFVECNIVLSKFDPWLNSSDPDIEGDARENWTLEDNGVGEDSLFQVSLDFRLRQGLGYMDQLKRLRRLSIHTGFEPRITDKDQKWMDDHWPSLESVQELARWRGG